MRNIHIINLEGIIIKLVVRLAFQHLLQRDRTDRSGCSFFLSSSSATSHTCVQLLERSRSTIGCDLV